MRRYKYIAAVVLMLLACRSESRIEDRKPEEIDPPAEEPVSMKTHFAREISTAFSYPDNLEIVEFEEDGIVYLFGVRNDDVDDSNDIRSANSHAVIDGSVWTGSPPADLPGSAISSAGVPYHYYMAVGTEGGDGGWYLVVPGEGKTLTLSTEGDNRDILMTIATSLRPAG